MGNWYDDDDNEPDWRDSEPIGLKIKRLQAEVAQRNVELAWAELVKAVYVLGVHEDDING
jgi:hypothetical protein